MNLAKNTIFILIAFFVDGMQAVVTWGVAIITAFPGTAFGGAAGCLVGNEVAGQLGCWIGGGVLGMFGSFANVLAPATVPVGIAVGIAVAMCISIVFGWGFLVPLMLFSGLRPGKRLGWGLGEMVPGINNVPFWSLITIMAVWKGGTEKGIGIRKRENEQQNRTSVQPSAGFPTNVQSDAPQYQYATSIVPIKNAANDNKETRTRTQLQDIRPATRPNAQAA